MRLKLKEKLSLFGLRKRLSFLEREFAKEKVKETRNKHVQSFYCARGGPAALKAPCGSDVALRSDHGRWCSQEARHLLVPAPRFPVECAAPEEILHCQSLAGQSLARS